jgi:hypothetical protein
MPDIVVLVVDSVVHRNEVNEAYHSDLTEACERCLITWLRFWTILTVL